MPVPPPYVAPLVAPVGAILRLPTPPPTPTPTPNPDGKTYGGCAAWLYLLHWDRPSRIAQLKNALGDSVNIVSEFYPPGSTVIDNTTTPWTIQRAGGLAVGGATDGSSWATALELSLNWQTAVAQGAIVEYHQGADLQSYIGSLPASVSVHSGAVSLYLGSWYPPGGGVLAVGPNVGATYNLAAFDPLGNQATWSWTITFGTDEFGYIKYGDDPLRPFQAYDETLFDGVSNPPTPNPPSYLGGNLIPVGSSIPGVTGTPTGKAAAFVRYESAKKIVSQTADAVNWGLYSFSDVSGDAEVATACSYDGNYQLFQHVFPTDSGKIDDVEAALQLVYYGGMYTQGGTPSKEGLKRAGADLYNYTYKNDKKIAFCDRPYGLIFATDGASNICNPNGSDTDWTGPPAILPCDCRDSSCVPPSPCILFDSDGNSLGMSDAGQYQGLKYPSAGEPWTSPCQGFYGFDAGCNTGALKCCDPWSRIGGSGYDCNVDELSSDAAKINHFKDAAVPATWNAVDPGFVAGRAESLFINGFADAGKNKVNVRTFVIGLSSTVGRCELNYTAFRGRTDASAPKGDAGYAYVTGSGDPGDPRLLQPGVDETDVHIYSSSIGGGDYAFFATDPKSIYDAFQQIIAGTAIGDYATSPPVAGSSVSQSNIVLIPSTDYPGWLGRLRSIDSLKVPGTPGYLRWDAGDILSNPSNASHVTPAQRKIYTWNPTNLAGGLIELTADAATAAAVQAIPGVPGSFTENVIDFLRGNDGTLSDPPTIRGWVFGASINVTPAIIGKPEIYSGTTLMSHASFEQTYKNRNPVAWVGADDGMLHAFDFNTGKEILALLPPELLPQQVTFYTNYKTMLNANGTHQTFTGQNPDIFQHIWGVANSLRFDDIYDGTDWKTIGYLALGPAGKSVTAIDITHPTSTDPNYVSAKPVEVLWRKSAADLPALAQAWSVPAIAAVNAAPSRFLALFGSGFNAASTATKPDGSSQLDANLFQLKAVDGTNGYTTGTLNNVTLPVASLDSSNRPLVGQQAFAASQLFDTTKPTYYGNNIANLGVQVDLNGRLWFNYPTGGTTDFDQVQLGIDVPGAIQQIEGAADQAPLYYPPSVSGLGTNPAGGCQVYSFGSGTAYEKSPLVTDPSGNAAPSGQNKSDYAWSPRLFVAVNKKLTAPYGPITVTGPNKAIYSVPISSIQIPPCLDPSDPKYDPNAPGCKLGPTDLTTLGPKTQMTAPPFLLVTLSGKGEFQALFLLFDPEAIGYCRGYSYIIVLSFKLSDACDVTNITKTEVFGAGEGAASGFAIAGTKVIVGKSGVGAGQQAGLVTTPINILSYGSFFGNVVPVYWRDLK